MRLLFTYFLLVSLLGCASEPIPQAKDNWQSKDFSVPAKESLILLLPPSSQLQGLEAGASLMQTQLGLQLQQAGFKVVVLNHDNYNKLWSQAVASVGGLFDPATGALRTQAYAQALSGLAVHVCREAGCSLMIQPRLVQRRAELRGSSAVWDGQHTSIPAEGHRQHDYRFSGATHALSVELMAVTSTGAWAFRSYGGASLLFVFNSDQERSELRRDLFQNEQEVAQGVRIALTPLR